MAFSAAAISAIGLGISTVGSYQQAKAQKAQANYQAAVAQKNQELAEDQARAQRREGYENMIKKRQEVAGVIAAQRAAQGASGAQVEQGSFLDLTMDTAEKGEIDALALYQKGLDNSYNSQVQAWNYGQQASAYKSAANNISPGWSAASTAIGGLATIGSNFGEKLWGEGNSPLWENAFGGSNTNAISFETWYKPKKYR